jgi:integrase
MASVYRPIYSKIDPQTGKRVKRKLSKWYIKYRSPDGRIHRIPGYTDREATKQLAARKEREAARQVEGMVNPFEDHHKRTLTHHLDDFETALRNATNKRGNKNTEHHIVVTVQRARKVMDGCGFKFIVDISADKVEAFLNRLTRKRKEKDAEGKPMMDAEGNLVIMEERLSIQSQNFYLAAAKQFCRWLVDSERTERNPLARLKRGNVALDRRHDRRALSLQELRQVLEATRCSPVMFRSLGGMDRFSLYAVAMGTGLRVSELASLNPASFCLSASPFVRVKAAYTKNREEVNQPLPLELVPELRRFLASKAEGKPVWPGTWTEKAAKMLRIDLGAAGVPYETDGLFADFHALRHSYITLLTRSGASTKVAQELARHSDVRLTMNRYSHAALYDLTAAVEKLRFFLPPSQNQSQALAGTGTDPAAHVPRHCPTGEIRGISLTTAETGEQSGTYEEEFAETLQIKPFETDCDGLTTADSDYARQDSNLQPMVPKTIALSS